MRKFGLSLLGLITVLAGTAQNGEHKKLPSISFSFGLFDFQTPQNIRNGQQPVGAQKWADTKQMDPTFGLSYIQGLNDYFDVAASYFLTSTNYPYRDKPTGGNGSNQLLQELDASIRMKLLKDNFCIVPYLSAGIGASMYKSKFDAFMPVGGGLQFRIAPEVFAMANMQYRIPVTQRANYHFVYNFGIAAPIAQRK